MAYAKKSDAIQYNNTYNSTNYDRIAILVPKGQKEEIQAYAKGWNISVNALYAAALLEKMQRDGPPPQFGAGAAEKEKE